MSGHIYQDTNTCNTIHATHIIHLQGNTPWNIHTIAHILGYEYTDTHGRAHAHYHTHMLTHMSGYTQHVAHNIQNIHNGIHIMTHIS